MINLFTPCLELYEREHFKLCECYGTAAVYANHLIRIRILLVFAHTQRAYIHTHHQCIPGERIYLLIIIRNSMQFHFNHATEASVPQNASIFAMWPKDARLFKSTTVIQTVVAKLIYYVEHLLKQRNQRNKMKTTETKLSELFSKFI